MRSEPRLRGLRALLTRHDAALFVAMHPPNVRYLTAFDGVFDEEPASLAVVSLERAWLVTDSRYAEGVSRAADGTVWDVIVSSADVISALAKTVALEVDGVAAVESSTPYRRYTRIEASLGMDVIAADGWVEGLRAVKEAEEISRIEAAQRLTDAAFDHIVGFIRGGMTEREIAIELEFFMRRAGSDGVAFPPIVASGPNSALPHAGVTDRTLERGDFLKLDFGARVDGYCADMTRTLAIGTPDDRQREVYDAVLRANRVGLSTLRAGVTGAVVDEAARAELAKAGLAEHFGHGLGHGVGLEVHESPSLSRHGNEPLVAGAVVTVEPGVYLPGFGGVRIEDLAVVEASGNRVLTASPKELIEL